MKKYSEWQKYVKEQSDKLKIKIDTGAPEPRREKPAPAEKTPRPARPAALQSPLTQRDVIIKRTTPVEIRERPPAAPAAQQQAPAPPPSPFVSVQDIWRAAEKSSKLKPPAAGAEPAPADRQKPLRPQLPAAARFPKPIPPPGALKEETREEILARLINPTLSLDEVAKIVGVCKATIRRYTAKGLLPHYRTPGNQRRFKLNDVLQFLESQRR